MTRQVTAFPHATDAPRHDVRLRWRTPAAGLWVATLGGDYGGMVEHLDGAYHARDGRGRPVGRFAQLDAALAAVDGGDREPLTMVLGR